jgi:hypothetical protein
VIFVVNSEERPISSASLASPSMAAYPSASRSMYEFRKNAMYFTVALNKIDTQLSEP